MSPECDRWIELADREAVGEPLSEEARAFQRAHVAVCPECAKETAIWRATRPAAVDAPPSPSEVDEVLRGIAELQQRAEISARRRRTLLVAAALPVACAAALVLWFQSATRPVVLSQTDASAAPSALGTPVAPSAGPSESTAKLPASNAARSVTASCSQPIVGVTVCVGPGTEVSKRELDGTDRLVQLERGRAVVSLVPQPVGTTFSIATGAGKVTAVGTIFSVEVGSDGVAVARVIHGRVLVTANGDVARPLVAGQALRLGAEKPTPLTAEERTRDLALLSLSGEGGIGDPAGAAPSASVRGTEQGSQGLLERARELRARGKFAEAADAYRKLHAASPQSPAGSAALVSLGELLLSSLRDPQGALEAFDAYLARGGALAQEAAFGRARALRALDRPVEERQAIERYLATYPDAPQGRVLRHRLAALGK